MARENHETTAVFQCHADNDRRLAKAANDGMLRKLRKEAQRESKAARKKLQRQLEQDGRGTKQKALREARSWASDEEEFTETLPRTDSGQGGRRLWFAFFCCNVVLRLSATLSGLKVQNCSGLLHHGFCGSHGVDSSNPLVKSMVLGDWFHW